MSNKKTPKARITHQQYRLEFFDRGGWWHRLSYISDTLRGALRNAGDARLHHPDSRLRVVKTVTTETVVRSL